MLFDSDALGDGDRNLSGDDSGAAVAFFNRRTEVGGITLRPFHVRDIGGLAFRLLETENIRGGFTQNIEKALLQYRPQAVYVPREKFHGRGGFNESRAFSIPFPTFA